MTDADPAALGVSVTDRSDWPELDVSRWAAVARDALLAEGVSRGELGLTFVAIDEMTELNVSHMQGSGPTDVLAFPLDATDGFGDSADGAAPDSDIPVLLGDIVVCPAVADRQAASHVGTFDGELTLLVVHGVLHILGHDHYHDDERTAMQSRERFHLDRYSISHPEFPS